MSGIHFSDLPPKYQRQAAEKLAAQMKKKTELPRRAKFGNVKTERAGVRFDSKKEAERFDQLRAMQAAGAVRDLRLQVEFTLQAAYTTPTGQRIRAIRYLADFTYERRDGDGWSYVVEDVKSNPTRTRAYLMKKKMMADKLGITITEV